MIFLTFIKILSLIIKNGMKNDNELIQLFQKGDKTAYDMLVRKYLSRTVGFFITVTGNKMLAEDLAQEVFFKLFKSLKILDSNLHFQHIYIA